MPTQNEDTVYLCPHFFSVPSMAQFLQVKVLPRVVTAKCSEPQATVSNDGRGGSGVAKPRGLRTETGYEAKRWVG